MRRIQRGCGAKTVTWRALSFGLLAGLLAGAMAGCVTATGEEDEALGPVEGFAGLVAADSPRAAVVGRDVLGNGGNAADAAVAMYFTMAVTLPSRAGLASGGVCVVFDNGDKQGEVLEFLPRAGDGGLVPLGVRAMAALNARQGLKQWGELLRPAENLARFGHGVSRALARDFSIAAGLLGGDREAARVFGLDSGSGSMPREGDALEQVELAAVMSGIRSQGAGYWHGGPFTRRLAEAMDEAGMPVSVEDLRGAVPVYRTAPGIDLGKDTAYFSGPPANGLVAAQLWQILDRSSNYGGRDEAERAHIFAEASMRAFADRAAWTGSDGAPREAPEAVYSEGRADKVFADFDPDAHTPANRLTVPPQAVAENAPGASLLAADRFGNAVSCSLTMNGLFGTGRMAPGTGMLLPRPASSGGAGWHAPSAVVVGNTVNGDLRFAAAASGGSAAATALVQVMFSKLEDGRPLDTAIRQVRLHHAGQPDELFYETGARPETVTALRRLGHTLQEAQTLGLVNALSCPDGILDGAGSCRVARDPRGFGLATVVR